MRLVRYDGNAPKAIIVGNSGKENVWEGSGVELEVADDVARRADGDPRFTLLEPFEEETDQTEDPPSNDE